MAERSRIRRCLLLLRRQYLVPYAFRAIRIVQSRRIDGDVVEESQCLFGFGFGFVKLTCMLEVGVDMLDAEVGNITCDPTVDVLVQASAAGLEYRWRLLGADLHLPKGFEGFDNGACGVKRY